MNSHSDRYEAAIENLRVVIASCQIGPNSPDDRDTMANRLEEALAEYETAKQDDPLIFPEV